MAEDNDERNMAEAVVEQSRNRFYCHQCSVEINPTLPVSKDAFSVHGDINNCFIDCKESAVSGYVLEGWCNSDRKHVHFCCSIFIFGVSR